MSRAYAFVRMPWPQLVAESVAIVVSILLAFWIDAWWDDRQERRAELDYLLALQSDFQATHDVLAEHVADVTRAVASVDATLAAISAAGDAPLPENFVATVGEAYSIFQPAPVMSTYDDMVSSGNLRLIRDEALRLAMTEVAEALEDVEFHTNLIIQVYWMRHAPFVDRTFVVSDFGWFDDTSNPLAAERSSIVGQTPRAPFNLDVDAATSLEFWNLLVGWKVMYGDQLGPVIGARYRCEDILEMLEARIDLARR